MKRIFFVEDDQSLIKGLSFALAKQGYETDIARTKLEAERLWQDGKYDLVILDVSLPDGSGYDICKKIRQTSKTPIIFLTAADEETDVIMGLDIGGDDYITKPFKLFLHTLHLVGCQNLVQYMLYESNQVPIAARGRYSPRFHILPAGREKAPKAYPFEAFCIAYGAAIQI